MSTPYTVHYLNRRGSRVWEIPLAGDTILRHSALVPVHPVRNPEPLRLTYDDARSFAQRLNVQLAGLGMPGKCFPVLDAPRVDAMAECREVYG